MTDPLFYFMLISIVLAVIPALAIGMVSYRRNSNLSDSILFILFTLSVALSIYSILVLAYIYYLRFTGY
jgi:ABC-type dipeptide/oligopeptide/nickel transport system permease component